MKFLVPAAALCPAAIAAPALADDCKAPVLTTSIDLTPTGQERHFLGSHLYIADQDVLPDISIGMDVLRQLHLYFTFHEDRLYVTSAHL